MSRLHYSTLFFCDTESEASHLYVQIMCGDLYWRVDQSILLSGAFEFGAASVARREARSLGKERLTERIENPDEVKRAY